MKDKKVATFQEEAVEKLSDIADVLEAIRENLGSICDILDERLRLGG